MAGLRPLSPAILFSDKDIVMPNRRTVLGALGALPFGLASGPLRAATPYEVTMLTEGGRMRFSPDLLVVPAGAQVTFTPASPGHNTQTTPGMIPEGAAPWRFGFGKTGTVTLSVPGFYGYHCLPHRGLGMVGLIIVEGAGMRANLAAAKAVKHAGQSAEAWERLWAKADAVMTE